MDNRKLRLRASAAWKQHFGTLVMMVLLLSVAGACLERLLLWWGGLLKAPPLLVQGVGSQLSSLTAGEVVESLLLLGLFGVVSAAMTAMTVTTLHTGMLHGLLRMLRGEACSVSALFSRMRACLKVTALQLWISLRAALWVLPGLGVVALLSGGVQALAYQIGLNARQTALLLSMGQTATLLTTLAMALRVALLYSMTLPVLADRPEAGVRDCLRRSSAMMKGRRWQLVCLCMPYLLAALATILVPALLLSVWQGRAVLSVWLAMIIALAVLVLMFVILPRLQLALAAFYIDLSPMASEPAPRRAAAPAPDEDPITGRVSGEVTCLIIALLALMLGSRRISLESTLLFMAIAVIMLLLSGQPFSGKTPEEALWRTSREAQSRSLRAMQTWNKRHGMAVGQEQEP